MKKKNKLLRNQNGAISMFVIVSVLFLTFVLIGIYASYANKLKAQEEQLGKIQENYGEYASEDGMDELYIAQTQPEEDNEDEKTGNTGTTLLPAEYQQVEYIQSTGTQYIDTKVNMSSQTQVEIDFQITQITSSNEEILTGAWDSSLNGFLFGVKTGYFQYAYGHSAWNGTSIQADTERHKMIVNKDGNAMLDEQILASVGSKTLDSTTSIYLFDTNIQRSWNKGIKSKIFNVKIYDNLTLIRDFIPCYRKSDNVIGLYDIVNDVFYTNQGTGTFVKGEDVI